jgi:hypothetical protein
MGCEYPWCLSIYGRIILISILKYIIVKVWNTQHCLNCLMLFREIIAVYSENHMKPINTLCGQNAEILIIKAGGTYSYHWGFKGLKRMANGSSGDTDIENANEIRTAVTRYRLLLLCSYHCTQIYGLVTFLAFVIYEITNCRLTVLYLCNYPSPRPYARFSSPNSIQWPGRMTSREFNYSPRSNPSSHAPPLQHFTAQHTTIKVTD